MEIENIIHTFPFLRYGYTVYFTIFIVKSFRVPGRRYAKRRRCFPYSRPPEDPNPASGEFLAAGTRNMPIFQKNRVASAKKISNVKNLYVFSHGGASDPAMNGALTDF